MAEFLGMEVPIYENGTSNVWRVFKARRFLRLWWSREAVTRTRRAMFGAWAAVAEQDRETYTRRR